MYLHFRHGFIEADAWDGQPVPDADHQAHLEALALAGTVIVVRSRRSDTLDEVVRYLPRTIARGVLPQIQIFESPPRWDYEFRTYLTAVEWGACLTAIAMDLDYRNFKHTMQDENPREYPLALAIWQQAHRHVPRDICAPALSITFGEPDEDEHDTCDRCGQSTWRVRVRGKALHCDECVTDEHDARGDYERDRQQDRERIGGGE